jgi:LEA14-like dessication related protein
MSQLYDEVEQPDYHPLSPSYSLNSMEHQTRTHRPRPYWKRLLRCEKPTCFRFVSICILTLTLLIAVLGIVLYPQVPEYSICNKSIRWLSLLEAIITYQMKAELEIQTSIYNPNRIDIKVHKLNLNMRHKGNHVASAVARDITLPAGSVTDVILVASVEPTTEEAIRMSAEYARGELFVDANVSFDTSIALWDRSLISYNASADYNDIDINGGPDRKWCKCD